MKWIKLDIEGCLDGSIRFDLSPAERGIWYELLLLAGRSRNPGVIQASNNLAYPIAFLAGQLRVSRQLLQSTLRKCESEGRISQDEDGIHITNWAKYQSEYQRQKKYREKTVYRGIR